MCRTRHRNQGFARFCRTFCGEVAGVTGAHWDAVGVSLDERAPKTGRRWVSVVILVLLVAGAATAGTWASFTASTTNDATFATGTLLLSESRPSVADCISTAPGDVITTNEKECNKLVDVAVKKPGDTASTKLALGNTGTIDGTDFNVSAMGSCTTTNASGTSYHGSDTNFCDNLVLTIQRFASASAYSSDDLTGSTCVYGNNSCTSGNTLTLQNFFTSYPNFGSSLSLGALATGASQYFKITLSYPIGSDNSTQGLAATFGLRWRLVQ
jgi:predicted ribosomally synthesized peptide with SipW-like signal peptide